MMLKYYQYQFEYDCQETKHIVFELFDESENFFLS